MSDQALPALAGPAPAVILVEPQLGENIGAAARAMANFGLTDLRLVAPRDGWPSEKARNSASGANFIIDAARLFATTEEALADLRTVYATTARNRDMPKPVVGPKEAVAAMRGRIGSGEAVGVMFGRERWGLTNEEVALSDAILTFPVNPAFASLNIAQAVLLVSYEWMSSGLDGALPTRNAMPEADTRPAEKQHLLGLMRHLEAALEPNGYFRTDEMRPTMVQNLRAVLQRAAFTRDEIDLLHGVVGSFERGPRSRPSGDADD